MLQITDKIYISTDDLVFKTSRSSGPGGQNVNKLSTRVTIFFNVPACQTLSDHQKNQILHHLTTRANKAGQIHVSSQKHRTQRANRKAATERLVELLTDALKTRPLRKKTKVPYHARQRRLEDKKRRSLLKQQRAKIIPQ